MRENDSTPAGSGFCQFEPFPWAAFEEREFLAELAWAWANLDVLSKAAELRLRESCPGPWEFFAEQEGLLSLGRMHRERYVREVTPARQRIVRALRLRGQSKE